MTVPLPEGIEIPDDNGAWLAVAAGNYHDADLALWTIKAALNGRTPKPGEQAHLDQLRQRRKDTYADLVTWIMTVEADRLGVSSAHVTVVTSARGDGS
jgi:hypothetical protein